jgi:SAM-dependent methyltransferase
MTTWLDVWSRRDTSAAKGLRGPDLKEILSIDGFDSDTGRMDERSWLSFISTVKADMGIAAGHSVFDVGCGAGAFLYPFARLWGCKVGGLDFAPAQVDICKHIFQQEDFVTGEALSLPTEPAYDFVASFSVFFYFPDLAYATSVLERMLRKARRGVMILDVPDLSTMDECESYRASTMEKGEYEKKYSGLRHLYYSRNWFAAIASQHGWQIRIENQNIENYVNNKFRFNCYLSRP